MNKAMTVNNKALTVNEIRNTFLKYMESKGHAIVPSSPLTPENDPTTLFTGSGMQPMLPYLLGQPHPLGTRIADSQKCFRSQDIEEVGDNRHTTFFEMLGNWSFGGKNGYFKGEQIAWMWDFLTSDRDECLGLNPKNFYVTCFKGNEALGIPRDTFSAELWQKLFKEKGVVVNINENPIYGMREGDRVFYYSEAKNWWSRSGIPSNMPEGEPGGPDSEMFYDFDPGAGLGMHVSSKWSNDMCHPNCDCGRFLEIGNNVFMQYKKVATGFEELPQMNVDHGSGLERYAAALRNDPDVFNTDVFDEAKNIISQLSGIDYTKDRFHAIDIIPDDNEWRGIDIKMVKYAYRVILDHIRAATFLIGDGVLPGNKDQMYFVRRLVRRAVRYARILMIKENFIVSVAESFIKNYGKQYDNLLSKRNIIISELEKEESKFRSTLEKGIKKMNKIILPTLNSSIIDPSKIITAEVLFDLYQQDGFPFELSIEEIKNAENAHGVSILSSYIKNFPDFYNDLETGFNKLKKEHIEASRTASVGKFKGGLGGDGVMEVKYHTATHLLHEALRKVLGESVTQKGSNITSERLRFDFAFERKVTDEEKKKVEDIVNEVINQALPVTREEISYNEARARGAIGLFGDKYGEKVSVYTVGKETGKRGEANLFSLEFCGGPHVNNTSELGIFKIQKEEAVSAGVRRIKGVLV